MLNQPEIFKATIVATTKITKRIKSFRLDYGERSFSFKPGQWIDLYAPIEGKNIGGYTITSSVFDKCHIELLIRESSAHPVTQFMHQISPPQEVLITEGQGRFFIDPKSPPESLIFIAGGIGITPLLSMFRSIDKKKNRLQIFYSVSNEEDIVYKDELAPYSVFTVTKNKSPGWTGETTRINLEMLKKYQANLSSHFYICGPRAMIDSMVTELKSTGVSSDQIHFEKWW